jgi:hypothetical protein
MASCSNTVIGPQKPAEMQLLLLKTKYTNIIPLHNLLTINCRNECENFFLPIKQGLQSIYLLHTVCDSISELHITFHLLLPLEQTHRYLIKSKYYNILYVIYLFNLIHLINKHTQSVTKVNAEKPAKTAIYLLLDSTSE